MYNFAIIIKNTFQLLKKRGKQEWRSQRFNSATRGYNVTKRFTYNKAFITKRKLSSFFLEFLKRILYCKFTLGNERLVICKRLGYVITASGRIGTLCC